MAKRNKKVAQFGYSLLAIWFWLPAFAAGNWNKKNDNELSNYKGWSNPTKTMIRETKLRKKKLIRQISCLGWRTVPPTPPRKFYVGETNYKRCENAYALADNSGNFCSFWVTTATVD